jgi:hypothetical protein
VTTLLAQALTNAPLAQDAGLALFVVEAPESFGLANQQVFKRPVRREGARWRYLDARWWSLPVGASLQSHLATIESWLDLWARRHLTDPAWRGMTGTDALLHVTLVAAWDGGAVARLTPHEQAHHTQLWRTASGLVDTPNQPIGLALLQRWNPDSAHGRMAAMASLPAWAWDGPTGTLIDPPQAAPRAPGRTGPRPGY